MLHFLDSFNAIYPLIHTVKSHGILNITEQLYNIQIMKIFLEILERETMDDTIITVE